MPSQGVNFTIQDNSLGLAAAGNGETLAVIGVSSAGTAYQPFQSSQPGPFVTTFGSGPGPELAAYLANAAGTNVVYVKVPTSGAGTNTAVVHTGTGSSVVTVTGTPLDSYYPLVTVLLGGTIGASGIQFTVSLDAGRTIYATVNLLTASAYVIANTGLTLNFGAGTMVAADTYSWVSQEPTWTDAGITSAMQSLRTLQGVTVEDILIAGVTASGNAANLDTNATTLFNNKRFNRVIAAARDALWGGTSTESEATWMTAIEADFANFSSTRVGITGGFYNFISPISSVQYRRPLLWGAGARDASVSLQIDLGEVDLGSIPMVLPSTPDGFIYHDESLNAGLDGARFMSMWSIAGLPGLYVKNPNLMAPPGSDFKWLQYGHVIDAACVTAYLFFVKQLSKPIRVNAATGTILAQDASKLQAQSNAALNASLGGKVSPAAGSTPNPSTIIDQTTNILATQALNVTIYIVPLAYPKIINVTLTFLNPALVQVANAAG